MKKRQLSLICIAILFTAIISYAGSIKIDTASNAQRNLIQTALGDQYPISKIAVVKSGNHSEAYYLGAVFHAKGVGDITGIWLVGGTKDNPNLVYSVNGNAHQFSGMRKASETKAAAYISDPEVDALINYFGN